MQRHTVECQGGRGRLARHALAPETAKAELCAAQTSGSSEAVPPMGDPPFCPCAQDEGSTLLSALATALSNCRLAWPAFLPVYDPLRDAWWGIAISGLGTIHYDSDSIHISKMPFHLQQVQAVLAGCTSWSAMRCSGLGDLHCKEHLAACLLHATV